MSTVGGISTARLQLTRTTLSRMLRTRWIDCIVLLVIAAAEVAGACLLVIMWRSTLIPRQCIPINRITANLDDAVHEELAYDDDEELCIAVSPGRTLVVRSWSRSAATNGDCKCQHAMKVPMRLAGPGVDQIVHDRWVAIVDAVGWPFRCLTGSVHSVPPGSDPLRHVLRLSSADAWVAFADDRKILMYARGVPFRVHIAELLANISAFAAFNASVYCIIISTRTWRRRKTNRCVSCGYLLSGLQGHVCPECGGSMMPRRIKTMFPSTSPSPHLQETRRSDR
jgi:hypothetical protein